MSTQRTTEQILSDLRTQYPITTNEEGKRTMARKVKEANEKTQDVSIRGLLQKHQNKKLTPDQLGCLFEEAFGRKVRTKLGKAITAITDLYHKDVGSEHIRFDFRGGWGKAVNLRAFIPQTHDGKGVQIRIAMSVVDGVWDATTAKTYEEPRPYEGAAIEDTSASGARNPKFFSAEKPDNGANDIHISIGEFGYKMKGPLHSDEYAEAFKVMMSNGDPELIKYFVDSMGNVKKYAENALLGDSSHWADDNPVKWEFEISTNAKQDIKIFLRCLRDGLNDGFVLTLTPFNYQRHDVGVIYGVGRFANLTRLMGSKVSRDEAFEIICAHLIDTSPDNVESLSSTLYASIPPGIMPVFREVPERDAMCLQTDAGKPVVEFSLVNGRVVKVIPKQQPKQQPASQQTFRHHQMDSQHKATSFAPRPISGANLTNLTPYQAQSALRVLVDEQEEMDKLKMLVDFINGIYNAADVGGTADALVFDINKTDNVVRIFGAYIGTNGIVNSIAELAVHL